MTTEKEYLEQAGLMYDEDLSSASQQLGAQLFGTQMRATIPRRAFTRIGRAINADYSKRIQ